MRTHRPRSARATALSSALVFLAVCSLESGTSRLSAAAAGSPQTAASGSTLTVSTASALQDAVERAVSGSTIVIAPGTYALSRSLHVRGGTSDLTIKGATSNAADVVLVGRGMANPDPENVPHGIIVEGGSQNLTIANLTIRDVYKHAILLKPGARQPRIQNVRLADAGGDLIRADGDPELGSVDGVLEHSVLEYTTTSRNADTSALEVAGGSGWTVRHNLFRNIRAVSGSLAGPAVLLWQGSRDSIVEANLFMNCQREIALGLEERTPHDHLGGLVRSNFIYRDPMLPGGVAILAADSPQTQVLHNTVLTNGSYAATIEYRFRDTTGIVVKNNLLDGTIAGTSGAAGTSTDNYTQANPSMFVNPPAGDLHLASGASAVFDQVPVLELALVDFDGQPRQAGAAADYGADERDNASDPVPPPPSGPAPAPSDPTPEPPPPTAPVPPPGVDPDLALPQPWVRLDIGGALGGSASWAAGTFTVRTRGEEIAGRADQFTFIYQVLEGDGDVVARVESLDDVRFGARAGVMIRNSLTADAKYAATFVTAGKGLFFQTRIANGAGTTKSGEAPGGAPYWVKLVRSGQTFTAFSSRDGIGWSVLGTEQVYLDKRVYVGLAFASGAKRGDGIARFTGVTVSAVGGSSNQSPSVAITTPSSGATYAAAASIDVTASAADPDGTVTKVDFYSGSTFIGSTATSPFRVRWENAPAGRHLLKAVAHDNQGAASASAGVEVEVTGAVNQPPVVSLSTPASLTGYTAPANIAMTASASDPDGTIAKVEFFAGTTRVGSDASSPYSVTWSGAPAGTHSLTAVAWDDDGSSARSSAVSVTVKGNGSPSVALTSPATGATYTAPATITFTASASDPDGSVALVEFYASGVLLGSDATSPYSYSVSGLPEGAYSLTARARDNTGASTTSAPVAITVKTLAPTGLHVLVFKASADHATAVTSYTVEVFVAGANPATATPFRTQKIGKPAPVNGDITADLSAMIEALPTGGYFLTVSAVGTTGTSRSTPSATFVR